MKNLAGSPDADKTIREELAIAKVPGVVELPSPMRGEVPTKLVAVFDHGGQHYTFSRAWYYWAAHGRVPMSIARQLYAEHRGDVRAGGDCACRPPETWAHWHAGGKEIVAKDQEEKLDKLAHLLPPDTKTGYIFSDAPETIPGAVQTVDTYHIDSQLGLCRFIELLTQEAP